MGICPIQLREICRTTTSSFLGLTSLTLFSLQPTDGYSNWNSIDLIHALTLHDVQIQLIANPQSYLGIESASRPIQRLDNNRSPRPARSSATGWSDSLCWPTKAFSFVRDKENSPIDGIGP